MKWPILISTFDKFIVPVKLFVYLTNHYCYPGISLPIIPIFLQMRNCKSVPHFFGSIMLAVLLSCSAPKALVYNDYKNFTIDRLGFANSAVKLDLEYYNPNNFGLQLKRTELDIFINNSFLGHSTSDSLIYIPRRDTFLIPIKFTVDMHNLFRNALNTLTQNEVLIKVNGNIKVGKANVFMNMPVNYEGTHKFSLF